MVAIMISDQLSPKTKPELIRTLQKQRISQIEVIEPFDQSRADELIKTAKHMSNRSGQVSIILLRTT
jgi:hypothetical protein